MISNRFYSFLHHPHTLNSFLTFCRHPSNSCPVSTFLPRIFPVFQTGWNLFCISGHFLPRKNFVSLAVITSLLFKSFPGCRQQPEPSDVSISPTTSMSITLHPHWLSHVCVHLVPHTLLRISLQNVLTCVFIKIWSIDFSIEMPGPMAWVSWVFLPGSTRIFKVPRGEV